MPNYHPPERTNLTQILEVADKRVKLPDGKKPSDHASVAFIRDLIQKGLIEPTYGVSIHGNRGQGRRLTPRAYRDLLKIIRLKALGHGHRSTWQIFLWLDGRDIPFESVRAAFLDEFNYVLGIGRKDIAPTGRWTEPFRKKYDKRVRQRSEGDLLPEMVDLMEPLAALMIRPSEATSVPFPIADVAKIIGGAIHSGDGASGDPLISDPTVTSLLTQLQNSNEISPENSAQLEQLANQFFSSVFGPMDPTDQGNLLTEYGKTAARLPGMLDNERHKSRLLEALSVGAEEQYHICRSMINCHRYSTFQRALSAHGDKIKPEDRQALESAKNFSRVQGSMMRHSPWTLIQFFASHLDDIVKTPVDQVSKSKQAPNRDILQNLRDRNQSR